MVGRGVADAFMVFVLPLSEEFGWKRAQVSSVYSAFLVITGLAAPLTGTLIDRWGPRIVYPTGLVLLGGACLIAGRLSQLWQFQLVIGLMLGMGVSIYTRLSFSLLYLELTRTGYEVAIAKNGKSGTGVPGPAESSGQDGKLRDSHREWCKFFRDSARCFGPGWSFNAQLRRPSS